MWLGFRYCSLLRVLARTSEPRPADANSLRRQREVPMIPFVDVAQAAIGFALSMGIGALVFPFREY